MSLFVCETFTKNMQERTKEVLSNVNCDEILAFLKTQCVVDEFILKKVHVLFSDEMLFQLECERF